VDPFPTQDGRDWAFFVTVNMRVEVFLPPLAALINDSIVNFLLFTVHVVRYADCGEEEDTKHDEFY
jgi:hypothetical protein